MLKYIFLLTAPFTALAQNNNFATEKDLSHKYVSLNNNKIYDVEIIIFAYKHALPNYKTYTNKALFNDTNAVNLQPKPDELNFIQKKQAVIVAQPNGTTSEKQTTPNSELTVSIADNQEDKQVLAWFQHESEFYSLKSIWSRLSKQDNNIIPLIHQSWRQVQSSFDQPTYVAINNLPNNQKIPTADNLDNNSINDSTDNTNNYLSKDEDLQDKLNGYPDFSVSGMVALSQGRFMHFGHRLNLIRHFTDESNNKRSMVFSLVERKQLKTDELHYFDSPWFGSIVKITEYKGDE